jgi:hypothetical protein
MRTPQAIIGTVLALGGAVFVLAIIGAELKPEDSVLIRLALTIAALLAMLGGTIAAVLPALVPGDNQTPERYLTELDQYQTGSAVFARQSFFASRPVKSIEIGITYEDAYPKPAALLRSNGHPNSCRPAERNVRRPTSSALEPL